MLLSMMFAAWLAAMLAIKFLIAPAIYEIAGIPGGVIFVLAMLAVAKRLED